MPKFAFDEDGGRVPVVDFDYDSVEDLPSEISCKMFPAMAALLRDVAEWATRGRRGRRRGEGMRTRFTVACWIMWPGVFGDVSQREIARRLRIDSTTVDETVTSFCDRFKVKKKRSGKGRPWRFVWGASEK